MNWLALHPTGRRIKFAAMPPAAAPPDLSHIETWIFDLDNTLYPGACNLFAQIDLRMTAFIADELRLDPVTARTVQKAYYHSHGTTLCGLMAEHGVEPERFLAFVHDIDLSPIAADSSLAAALARLPGRRIVYTNGSARHAERVIDKLGLAGLFEAIHDITAAGYRPKPWRPAYEALIERHGITPERAAMFEDIARNLEVPHALGMTTVLVLGAKPWERAEDMEPAELPAHVDHTVADLAPFLATARVMSYERAPQERG
jgi:putative hydrolase of the HAD superfamily